MIFNIIVKILIYYNTNFGVEILNLKDLIQDLSIEII